LLNALSLVEVFINFVFEVSSVDLLVEKSSFVCGSESASYRKVVLLIQDFGDASSSPESGVYDTVAIFINYLFIRTRIDDRPK
jgi:hypothetical protein